jgi:TolB protein
MKKLIGISFVAALLFSGMTGCTFLQGQSPEIQNWEPVLSPDGTAVAFESPGKKGLELYVRGLESGEVTQVTENEVDDWSPTWSPQGDRLVFASNREKNVDLYIIDLETREVFRLTTHEGDDVNPYWGANGQILFNSNRSGVWEIYMMNPSDQSLIKITETSEAK